MRRAVGLPVTLILVALSTLSLTSAVAWSADIVVEENITYGKVGDTELKLDLARPEGDGPFPAIVFIHGGGWAKGNRQTYRVGIEAAARRGCHRAN